MNDLSSDSPISEDRDYLETLESCDLIALLRLNNGSPAAATHVGNRPQYTACASNSMKRRSPSSSSSPTRTTSSAADAPFSEPKPKKLFVEQGPCDLRGVSKISLPTLLGPFTNAQSYPVLRRCDSDPTKPPVPVPAPPRFPEPEEPKSPKGHFVEQEECHLNGFSKISLPISLGTQTRPQSHPVLRRSVSDLTHTNPPPAVSQFSPEPTLKMGICPETPSPKKGSGLASALPPLPPSLRRTVSDLTPSGTPPKTSSSPQSSVYTAAELVDDESSDSMRLRRMKDRLAEMGQWCNEVTREEEDANARSEDVDNNTAKDVSEEDHEESVSVERVGESFTIQFKCPCGKGYQILISGNSCYYKLM